MARPLRLEYSGALWHVTSRGNEQREIFRDDADRLRFLELLASTVIRFGWRLYAWVLMSNHFHLELSTPEPNLSRGMHWLNTRYVQWFNRRYKRSGHLFQGRFKGKLIEREAYLVEVARYTVLNPVRAGMVTSPEEYRWSSYRQTAGVEPAAPFLAVGELLALFGPDQATAQEEYRRFVHAKLAHPGPSLWDLLVGQIYLGSAKWLESIQEKIDEKPRSEEHPRTQLEVGRPLIEDVVEAVAQTFDLPDGGIRDRSQTTARQLAAYLAFEEGLVRLSTIATALGISRGSVSALVARCRSALPADDSLRSLLDACRGKMRRHPPPRISSARELMPAFHRNGTGFGTHW